MRREAHQIDVEVSDVEWEVSETLARVAVEEHSARAGDRRDAGEVLRSADLVVGEHDRHQHRVVAQRALQLVEIDAALRVDRERGHPRAISLQTRDGIEHRLVLGRLGDDVVAPVSRVGGEGALDG